MIILNDNFKAIAKKINKNGGRLYLVGGAVRDIILGKEPHDMDFCVTGIEAIEFSKLFNAPRVQGKSFPVFVLNGCEFALARKEKKNGVKHTDFEIISDKSITIEEDLARRDLTINSMAIDVLTNEIIDPYGGIQDVKNGLLRMTTQAYIEDPLRVYRTARFSATLCFEVEKNTIEVMKKMKDDLFNLSAERVCTEFRKALKGKKTSLFFETLRKADLLGVHFKELANLIGVEQPQEFHPEGDAYVHTLQVLDKACKETNNIFMYYPTLTELNQKLVLAKNRHKTLKIGRINNRILLQKELIRFCALVHDFGKGLTPREEWPHHYDHEKRGVEAVEQFCKRLKMSNKFQKAGKLISQIHMKAGIYDKLKTSTKIKMFMDIDNSKSISFEGVEIIAKCDSKREIKFAKTARRIMKYGMTNDIIEKCTNDEGKFDYIKAKEMVLQERIKHFK